MTRSLFGDGIPRRLLRRVSLAKRTLLLCGADDFAKRSLNLGLFTTDRGEKDSLVVIGPERAKILASRHKQLRAKSVAESGT